MSTVYIIFSETLNKYYVGCTDDLVRRLIEHNSKAGHFTSPGAPWRVVHLETFSLRLEALKREREIKSKKSRRYIESLLSC
jgi:putative endonuclease